MRRIYAFVVVRGCFVEYSMLGLQFFRENWRSLDSLVGDFHGQPGKTPKNEMAQKVCAIDSSQAGEKSEKKPGGRAVRQKSGDAEVSPLSGLHGREGRPVLVIDVRDMFLEPIAQEAGGFLGDVGGPGMKLLLQVDAGLHKLVVLKEVLVDGSVAGFAHVFFLGRKNAGRRRRSDHPGNGRRMFSRQCQPRHAGR